VYSKSDGLIEQAIVGDSLAIQYVLNQVRIVAKTDSMTLIQGETGTGKEVIARAIHDQSLRNQGPFVKLNCAAIPGPLLESELFGHERGAFTGAFAQTKGRFQLADKGTLFLDEIGDLPLELQPKLLRVLQEQEFERLGSSQTIRVDVRVVAATNQDLAACGQQAVSRRPILSVKRNSNLPSSPAGPRPGHSLAGGVFRKKTLGAPQQTHSFDSGRSDGNPQSARLAGQYS
jgi:transcriptional regulator with GAF, ATPase, and Fis domain